MCDKIVGRADALELVRSLFDSAVVLCPKHLHQTIGGNTEEGGLCRIRMKRPLLGDEGCLNRIIISISVSHDRGMQ